MIVFTERLASTSVRLLFAND